jgi:hypothetical protein
MSPPFFQFSKGVYNDDIKSASRVSKMWVNLVWYCGLLREDKPKL